MGVLGHLRATSGRSRAHRTWSGWGLGLRVRAHRTWSVRPVRVRVGVRVWGRVGVRVWGRVGVRVRVWVRVRAGRGSLTP